MQEKSNSAQLQKGGSVIVEKVETLNDVSVRDGVGKRWHRQLKNRLKGTCFNSPHSRFEIVDPILHLYKYRLVFQLFSRAKLYLNVSDIPMSQSVSLADPRNSLVQYGSRG